MNEHRRTLSNRYYVTGIAVCVLVLFYLIFLSWKKIFKFEGIKKKAGGDEAEGRECHSQKEYVPF